MCDNYYEGCKQQQFNLIAFEDCFMWNCTHDC